MVFNSYVIIHIARTLTQTSACMCKDRGFMCDTMLQQKSLPHVENSYKAIKMRCLTLK